MNAEPGQEREIRDKDVLLKTTGVVALSEKPTRANIPGTRRHRLQLPQQSRLLQDHGRLAQTAAGGRCRSSSGVSPSRGGENAFSEHIIVPVLRKEIRPCSHLPSVAHIRTNSTSEPHTKTVARISLGGELQTKE